MKNITLIILLTFFWVSCSKPEPEPVLNTNSGCSEAIILDSDFYQNGPDEEELIIQEASIEGDCMKLKASYGGGCGDVVFKLVTIGIQLKIPNHPVRLSLDDDDNCEALIWRDLEYDLTPLQPLGTGQVTINLAGWPDVLEYNY